MGDTSPSAVGSASLQVLATPELFEGILLELEMQDLLGILTVSRFWNRFISTSPALQQKLFFKPCQAPKTGLPMLNPLLQRFFAPLFSLERPEDHYNMNHLTELCQFKWFEDEARRARMLRPDASWRRMFPVQPPAKLECIKIVCYDSCLYSEGDPIESSLGSEAQKLQESGVNMGLLYDIATILHDLHPSPSFFVHWKMFPLQELEEGDQESLENDVLFYNELEIENAISLHHRHETLCFGNKATPSLLKIDSPFMAMIEEHPDWLFEFNEDPQTYATNWDKHIPPKPWSDDEAAGEEQEEASEGAEICSDNEEASEGDESTDEDGEVHSEGDEITNEDEIVENKIPAEEVVVPSELEDLFLLKKKKKKAKKIF